MKRIFLLVLIIYGITLPLTLGFPRNSYNVELSNNLNTQANGSKEDSILWKLGKGIPGTGASMKPRLVNFSKNGDSLIIVGTDEGLAAITLDGLINMSYQTFGPVIDFNIIEDISGDAISDIILITYYNDHPNLIAIASNNGTELWKFKPTIEGISTETYETQEFITYTWDLDLINDIDEDSISDIVITSWYRVIVISGKSGGEIWMRDEDFDNDIWKIDILEDINNNGYDTIIAGSEGGKLSAFDSKTGEKHWSFKVDEIKFRVRTLYGFSTHVVPNSIDDIKVISDADNDNIDEILIAADDGFLRVISGKTGIELENTLCYNVTLPQATSYYTTISTSEYSSVERLFTNSGIKIYEIPDINNDGISEFISIACDLDLTEPNQEVVIQGRIFHIDQDFQTPRINVTYRLNWTYDEHYQNSAPEIIESPSGIRIYFYQYGSSGYNGWYSESNAQIVFYDINDKNSENPSVVYNDPDEYSYSSRYASPETAHYFLNIEDINTDGIDELFAISANGRYLCLDIKNNETLWVRSRKDSELKINEISDLNSDGYNDFLIEQISDFEPEWIDSSDDSYSTQITEQPKIINDLYTINGKTGTVIWTFDVPTPQIYEGLRDLKNVGDITDDNIEDFVGWMIPSTVPSEISQIIEDLTGDETIDLENFGSEYSDLYRTLLFKYTKLIAINGSNGAIIWDTLLLDFPYKFYRQYGYTGPYEDPIELYNSGEDFYNRIDSELPDSWGSYGEIVWDNNWATSSLTHPSNIEIINGTGSGNIFDLGGDQGNYYVVRSYNSSESSESLKIGSTTDTTSIGTVKNNDDVYWELNSVKANGYHHILAELSFKPSQSVESALKHITVNYTGFLSNDVITEFDISVYNFSSDSWKKISTAAIENQDPVDMIVDLYNITELTGLNGLVKIKVEAKNTTAFSIFIDKLGVDYSYPFNNYTISSEWDGDSWKTIFDLVIPIDFSSDKTLGVMDYTLSQIERFSAFKLESNLAVNTTNNKWYNFSYEIKDISTNKWILCNWSHSHTWNNYSYPDLQGKYGGYRDNYTVFDFDTEFREDRLWLITRGTHDADEYVDLDYANPTTLSNFIDSNKNIRIRLNITNEYRFNLSIDNFGLGMFYWGLFSSEYDKNYIWDYSEEWNEIKLTTDNLLNLEIQDFEVINGTNDEYLDIIAITGIEGTSWSSNPNQEWSSTIHLFDIKNKKHYTKWSLNKTYIPYQNIRVLPINNSLNYWILSGIFQFGNNYSCSHKLVGDPHWGSKMNHLDNYDESKTIIDFIWEEIPEFSQEYDVGYTLYEFPEKTYVTKNGKIGLITGKYEYVELDEGFSALILSKIRILNINNLATYSEISTENLDKFGLTEVGNIDFSSESGGYKLLLSYEDFNNDGFLDHIGFYEPEFMGEWSGGKILKIYSGNSGDADSILLYSNFYEDISLNYPTGDYSEELIMPFTSIDDINNDGIPDALIGIQSSYKSCRGAYLKFYDIYNSNENELNELTEYEFILDPIKCTSQYYTPTYEFIFNAKKIGDFNADNCSEVLIYRNFYDEVLNEYGYIEYEEIPRTEIIDINKQNILYRFNVDIDSIYPIRDLNNDTKSEFLVSSDEIIYCISSKFGVQILDPKDTQSMGSHAFDIKWETDSDYDYFEVFIDGVSQGPTKANKIHLSLGSGWRQISIIMYDKTGLIITISTIKVLIPSNVIHLVLTFVFLGVITGLYIVYRRYSKKKLDMVLIDKKIKDGGKKK